MDPEVTLKRNLDSRFQPSFASKAAATKYFQLILHRHEIGAKIPEPDASALLRLLERHPDYEQKRGAGISYFIVENTPYGKTGFRIVRVDGSSTDFSYLRCVAGKAPASLDQALKAMRAEVADDIFHRKRAWFRDNARQDGTVPCAVTGEKISIAEAHADHAPPRTFKTLAVAFLTARQIDLAKFVTPSRDNQYEPRIDDPTIAEAWRSYHHRLAVIRIVHKRVNLARAHEGAVKERDRQLRFTTHEGSER